MTTTTTTKSVVGAMPTGNEPLIAGPFHLFDGSFVVEFLQPGKDLDASVLMRATYIYKHPLTKLEKAHPQAPPLHLHFAQSESFLVLSGAVGTTTSYSLTDTIHTPSNTKTPYTIPPWLPHRFWPVAQNEGEEDTVMLVWAHPSNGAENEMDALFFLNILSLASEMHLREVKMGFGALGQLLVTQHASDTVMICLPGSGWAGPLRWWVPWVVQGVVAWVAKVVGGKTPLMEKYTPKEDWERKGRANDDGTRQTDW